MLNAINSTSLHNIRKAALFILPIALIGCSSSQLPDIQPNTRTDTQHQEAKAYLQQLKAESQNAAFMVHFIAKEREENCNAPYTKSTLEALAKFDPIVAEGTALQSYSTTAVFPAYLSALKVTMNCDSNQWMKDVNEYVTTSPVFKTNVEMLRSTSSTL